MGKRVLVADDHPPTVTLIRSALEAKGLTVTSASNGAECLLAIDTEKPDLVVLDVIMPIMDGFTACERIREFSTVPIIILTAKGEERDRV